MKILVAGMGNVLRGDDGFGIRVIEALAKNRPLPAGAICMKRASAASLSCRN